MPDEINLDAATERVAQAEQRHERATAALDAAEDEHVEARRELRAARRDLGAANRALIDAAKREAS